LLVDAGLRGDFIDPRPGQSIARELPAGCDQQFAASVYGIAPARHGARFVQAEFDHFPTRQFAMRTTKTYRLRQKD
jgi:hypothetical protein